VIHDLKRTFPRIKFVATTHSPLEPRPLVDRKPHALCSGRYLRRRPLTSAPRQWSTNDGQPEKCCPLRTSHRRG
jgi:hypothetical protein